MRSFYEKFKREAFLVVPKTIDFTSGEEGKEKKF